MSGLFKQKQNVPQAAPQASSVRFNTSCYGKPIPILYGKNRVAGNALWYNGFKAIAHTTQQSVGGKGGSSGTIEQTTYTYEVGLIFGFCEGPVKQVGFGFAGRSYYEPVVDVNTVYDAEITSTVPITSPYNITVPEASKWSSTTDVGYWGIASYGDSGDFGVWVSMSSPADYTVANGVYTFNAAHAGKTVRIQYKYQVVTGQRSSLDRMGLTFFNGSYSQTPWSYLVSNYPDQALGYRGIAYAASPAYQLGDSADIPNTSLEIESTIAYSSNIPDANPRDVIVDLATNPYYGGYYAGDRFGDLKNYSDYCVAAGLFISPCYTEQQPLADMWTKIARITNSEFVWSGGKLKLIPYADAQVTGNGVTWVPNLTAVYDLTDDDFAAPAGQAPVRVRRKSPQDRYNHVVVKFYNRALFYNEDVAEAKDAANVERYGLRTADAVELYEIADASVAKIVAQLLLQRHISINVEYEFELKFDKCLLEPMDLVTLTDATLGLSQQLVRILEIEEQDDALRIRAEEVPVGSASAVLYPRQVSAGYVQNYNATPANVEPPVFFEPPVEYTQETGLSVWCAVTGQATDPLWGGCTVWASLDGSTYKRVGTVTGGARYGTLQATLQAGTAQTLDVLLSGKGGQLLSATAAEAGAEATLSLLTNGSSQELLSYQNATLTAANRYSLTPLVRGQYSTNDTVWPSGTRYVRLDNAIVKHEDLPISYIGRPLYFKFTSFNIYGSGEQGLADVSPYTYTVTGYMVKLPPPTVSGLGANIERYGVRLSWNKSTAVDVAGYEVRRGSTSDTWDTAVSLFKGNATSYLWDVRTAGTYRFFVKAYDSLGYESTVAASADFTITAPSVQGLSVTLGSGLEARLSWTGSQGSHAIAGYELRYGASWAGGVALGFFQTTSYAERIQYANRTYWVAAVDVAGNVGSPVSVPVNILLPSAVQGLRADVVDNNVLLFWSAPALGSLAIERYEVRRGATWESGTVIGSNGSSTFTTYFEVLSGTYTYWVAAVDIAGNVGTPASISARVDQPPDFKLNYNQNDDFSGAKTNALVSNGVLFAPVNTTETWAEHFVNNGWTSFQSAINAGKVYYAEPNPSSATYVDIVDLGVTLTSSIISVVTTAQAVYGSVAISVTIEVSNTSGTGPWTQLVNGTTGFFTNFRWIRVTLTFTSDGGNNDLLALSILNERASVKLVDLSGVATIDGTAGGTPVYLTDDGTPSGNKVFADVDTIIVTPQGNTALIPVVDFLDVADPLSFKVLLFNDSGTRITTGTVRWTARGIRKN